MPLLLQTAGGGRAARAGRQPRPVRGPGLALAGLPDPALRDLAGAARPAGLAGGLVRAAASRCSTRWPRCSCSPGSSSAGRASSPWRLSPSRRWPGYLLWPDWFTRFVAVPARDCWRHWFYRRRWKAAMTLAGLAPTYRGRVLVPVLAAVHAAGAVDLVTVRLVTGQAPERLRRPDAEPRPCLRRAAVPGPRRHARAW